MRTALLIFALFAVSFATVRQQFLDFQRTYGKIYATQDEFDLRFNNFKANLRRNVLLSHANPQATFGINKFSDLSQEEFASMYLMNVDFSEYQKPPIKDFSVESPPNQQSCNPDATNYDWGVDCGATTPVYNQGQCGSCWAFSATETIESYYYLSTGNLVSLSVEQIVSCDTAGQDQGCGGGYPSGAYTYVEGAGGIEPWSDYPYNAESGNAGPCTINGTTVPNPVTTVTGYSTISGESGLYQQLSSSSGGPVSVCVDATTWQTYTGGVITSCPSSIDHCVQAVGYANYGQSGAYWIVRNSWGSDWGENGFIWVAIGQDLCAIGDEATVVTTSTN